MNLVGSRACFYARSQLAKLNLSKDQFMVENVNLIRFKSKGRRGEYNNSQIRQFRGDLFTLVLLNSCFKIENTIY